jgi:hypothetical protein
MALLAKIKGSLGSHSNQKFPATWCAENGCTDPEVEVGGRWKGDKHGRVVNIYIIVEKLTTDTKRAGVLAVDGPIMYKLKDDSHVSLPFLKSTVAPKMHAHFGVDPSNCIVSVLELPLLWACHEPSLAHMIHPQVLSRVQQGYISISIQHGVTYNPMYKVPLHILRVENLVFIQDAIAMGEGEGEATYGSQLATAAAQSSPSRYRTSYCQSTYWANIMRKTSSNPKNTCESMNRCASSQFKQVHTNMNRCASSPTRRVGPTRPRANDGVSISHTLNNAYDSTAKLSSFPRNLLLLWQEYLYGLEGNKAAKTFTLVKRECDRVKFKFFHRT